MQKKYLYFLSAAHLCCDINNGALPALLPFFVSVYGMDYTAAAGLMFASCCLSSVIQPMFGYLADKISKTSFMAIGVLISGLSLGTIGFMTEYWAIFAAVTFMGIGAAIFHPEAAQMVNRVSGAKKGMGMSMFSVGGNAGFGIGPLMAVALVSFFGFKGLSVFAVIAVIMSIALFVTVPKIKHITIQQAAAANSAETAKTGNHTVRPAGENNWPAFSRLTLVIICRSVAFCGLESFLPLFCVQLLNQPEAVGSSTLTILSLIGIVTTLIGGALADRFGYIKIIQLCMVLFVPLTALIAFSTNILAIYLLLLPLGFAISVPYSSFVVLGQTYLAKNVGFASGVTLGLSFSIGGILVPLLGWFGDSYGLLAVMQLLIGITAAGAICSFALPKLK